jgi:hypothetical protein
MNTINFINEVHKIVLETSNFEFKSHFDEFHSKFNENSYRLESDYDDLVVGITTTGALIYDFEEVYCRYMEINEEIGVCFEDFNEFIEYAMLEVKKMVRPISQDDCKGKILPMLLGINKSNYEMKYD